MGWLKKKEPRPLGLKHLKVASDPNDGDKFRALSKLAGIASDLKKEREFSIQESRSRRFWHDKPLGGVAGTVRFWRGLALESCSNFGRSIARPLMIWVVSVFVFASYYFTRSNLKLATPEFTSSLPAWLGDAPEFAKSFIAKTYGLVTNVPKLDCAIGGAGAWQQTLDFSLKTSLLRAVPSGELISENFAQCLFGARQGVMMPSPVPIDVSLVAAVQIGSSILLISLFMHAIWIRIMNS